MSKLDGKSKDLINENIEKLKEIFPEVFSEGKIDFSKLEVELGKFKDDSNERYNFTWNGKSEAKKIALTPSTGTLRPCKNESKNWDTTKNLYIEGDNLEVLKLLQKSYHKKVKMIYIDPPYNTGKDFVYKDNFKDNIKNYLEITRQVDSNGNRLSTNSETSGRYHSDWLNMMYPRLKLARNLLKDDGVIFISIDDNEVANLRKLCDEIFGEKNFIRNVIWEKKYSPANDSKVISDTHDHILVYSKNISEWIMKLLPRTEEMNKRYSNPDNDPRGLWKPGGLSAKTYSSKYDYPIVTPSGKTVYPPTGSCWQVSREKLEMLIRDNKIYFGKEGDAKPQIKQFLTDVQDGVVSKSIWKYDEVGHNQTSRKELTDLFDGEFLFDNPKPTTLIERIFDITTFAENDIVLDFFSGSGSTAHAVFKYNLKHNLNLHFILIQIPDRVTVNSVAEQKGYKNICEIGKERIRRAGEIVKSESKKDDLDIGFKVLKLDSSNIKSWDSDFENLETNLLDAVENIKSDRSEEDLLYEILLKYGFDLTLEIEEKEINGKKLFNIGFGSLIICLDEDISIDITDEIIAIKKENKSEITRVVFKDSGFKNAVEKTNIIKTLNQNGIDEIVSV